MNRIEFGDCRDTMRKWAADGIKAQTCVTSPPYYGLRDYGHEGQIGLEETPDEYIKAMVEVFRCVWDVLEDDGTLWLNIGDSYAAQRGGTAMPAETLAGGVSGKGNKSSHRGRQIIGNGTQDAQESSPSRNNPVAHRNCKAFGLKHKDLIGIPWMLAFALRADGWYLRQDIIWHKPNPMPESVQDRCTKAHEYIFLMSKSQKYHYDADAIKESVASSTVLRMSQDVENQKGSDRVPGKTNGPMKAVRSKANSFKRDGSKREQPIPGQVVGTHRAERLESEYDLDTRNKRSVWTVSTKPYAGAHFAVFPSDLIEPCILAGAPVGGIVLDPFMGSGTTAQVAQNLGRQYLGCELNPEYEALQKKRLSQMSLGLD
jgi:DNA modification methylase